MYDATGTKLRKTVRTNGTVTYVQDYLAGGIEYRQNGVGTKRVESVFHPEGRYFNVNAEVSSTISWRREYNIKDHLGNTRVVITDRDADGVLDITGSAATNEVLQEQHYYAFGLGFEGPWVQNDAASRDNRYLYNGKELNDDFGLGWNDYGARWYDAAVGRWNGVDPKIEKYETISGFAYCFNNTIRYFDPDGADPGDVLVAFGGADFKMTGDIGATQRIVDALNSMYFDDKGGASKGFVSQLWDIDVIPNYYGGPHGNAPSHVNATSFTMSKSEDLDQATQEAYDYVVKNHADQGKVVLFGYSYGGVLATHLEKRLKKADIKVDLLITVDAAAGRESNVIDRVVSDNTVENLNIYQPNPSSVGSRGGKNTREDGSQRGITNVIKVSYTDSSGKKRRMNHSVIFNYSFGQVIRKINDTLRE